MVLRIRRLRLSRYVEEALAELLVTFGLSRSMAFYLVQVAFRRPGAARESHLSLNPKLPYHARSGGFTEK